MAATKILILTALLELVLFHTPATSDRVVCRADNYYWLTLSHYKGKIFIPRSKRPNLIFVNTKSNLDKFGYLYLAKFRTTDGSVHLTTVKEDGTMSFTNNANIVGRVKVLSAYLPFNSTGDVNGFQFNKVWPGTMQSSRLKGSPDLREASVIVGIENGRFVYLGAVLEEKPVYGRIVEDARGKYELIYRDMEQVEKRTDRFQVLTSKSCANMLEMA